MRRLPVFLAAGVCVIAGCGGESRDAGAYRIAAESDQFIGLFCQTRVDFYDRAGTQAGARGLYLGSCGSPGYVTDSLHMPADHACFAVAADGQGIVYLHRPELCGAGRRARAKPGGVYVHSVTGGDHLLYPDTDVNQVWGGHAPPADAIRVAWRSVRTSRTGAQCGQYLVIHADGREEIEGQVDPKGLLCRE